MCRRNKRNVLQKSEDITLEHRMQGETNVHILDANIYLIKERNKKLCRFDGLRDKKNSRKKS